LIKAQPTQVGGQTDDMLSEPGGNQREQDREADPDADSRTAFDA